MRTGALAQRGPNLWRSLRTGGTSGAKTQNAWVIVGRKTLGDFPGAAPAQPGEFSPHPGKSGNSRSPNCPQPGEALAAVAGQKAVFVIGGASVYGAMLPFCTRVYVTKVGACPPPMYSSPIWTKTRTGSAPMPALSAGRREFPTVFVYTPGAHIGFDPEFPHFSIFVARSIWTNGHLWDIMKP